MGFYIQDDYWEALEGQPSKVRNEVLGALCELYFTGDAPTLTGLSRSFFVAFRERVAKARQKARQKQNEREANAATDAATNSEQDGRQNKQPASQESERGSESKRKNQKTHRARFAAPTESEFCEYAISKGATPAKAKELFCYYASQDWRKANGLPLANWKIAITGALARDASRKGVPDAEYSTAFGA